MSKTTAIVLVTYNGWALTEACLKDIEPLLENYSSESADDEYKFIVSIADNCSTDGTVEKIRELYPPEKFPNVRVYPQGKNAGPANGNNAGIRCLLNDGFKFDAVCILNNDTRFDASAILNLRKEYDRANQWMASNAKPGTPLAECIMCPKVLNRDGSRQNNFFSGFGPARTGYLPFLLNAFRNEKSANMILEGEPEATELDSITETYVTSCVCWIMGLDTWNKVGCFDENIFMYYDDTEFCYRCHQVGSRIFLTNQSTISHLCGGSSTNNTRRALMHDRSQQYVFKKHFGIRGLLLSKSFRILRSSLRVLFSIPGAVAGKNAPDKRAYAKHHFALLKEAILR